MKSFDELFAELSEKAVTRPEGSGTVAELDAGVHAIGKKIVEEAAEVWMAAEHESDERTAEEISRSEAIPLGTAKTRIRLGLRRIRAQLTTPAEET